MGKFFILQRKLKHKEICRSAQTKRVNDGDSIHPELQYSALLHCKQSHQGGAVGGAHFPGEQGRSPHCSILLEGRFGGEGPFPQVLMPSYPSRGPTVGWRERCQETQPGHTDVEFGSYTEILAWLIPQRARCRRWSEAQRCSLLSLQKVVMIKRNLKVSDLSGFVVMQ